jgi:CTP synthase
VNLSSVIESIDVSTIYEVPLLMLKEKLDVIALEKLNLPLGTTPDLQKWKQFISRLKNPKTSIKIGLVGKYVELPDAYKSIVEALVHAGSTNECKVEIITLHSETINEENVSEKLEPLQGILVAPGFGHRGIEGKILAVKYAREKMIPFLGICLGMQCAVIEFSRNVLGHSDANSTEMSRNTSFPVIDLMEDQKDVTEKGGTMRLGAYPCSIKKNSKAHQAYKELEIFERHRHRYELNNAYLDALQKNGLIASGVNTDTGLVEIVELENHPWFIGVQFHPEYKSTVVNPHPLFVNFIKAALANRK